MGQLKSNVTAFDSKRVSMQDNEMRTAGDAVGLKEIAGFLKRNQRLITLFGAAGLLLCSAYAFLAPKKYEATWQIKMAQFDDANGEEVAVLIQRLRLPTAYPAEVQQHCGMPEDREFGDYLGGKLEIQQLKDATAVVGMRFRAASPALARQCAEDIVTMVVAQQRGVIDERLIGRQAQLERYQQAFTEELRQLERIKSPELGSFSYLARLDKLSWLRTRIDALQQTISLSQLRPARLVSPIYTSSKPVSPKIGLVLPLGLLLGLMLGTLYALAREGWRKEA